MDENQLDILLEIFIQQNSIDLLNDTPSAKQREIKVLVFKRFSIKIPSCLQRS